MGLKCVYAFELIGLLKITTVVLLFTSLSLMSFATGHAAIYRHSEYQNITDLEGKCKVRRHKANRQGIQLPPCPENWMGYTALGIFTICCVVCVSILLIQSLPSCGRISGNKQFQHVDFFYHFGAGLAVFFGGSCAMAFGILAIIQEPCGNESGVERVNCENVRGWKYHPEIQIFAGILGIIAGMTCGFAGIKMHNREIFPDVYTEYNA